MANELKDHERAHSGQPGSKVRHGADATQTRYPRKKLAEINDHREALGYRKFPATTPPDKVQKHYDLVQEHAPYGNDPWGRRSLDPHGGD